VSGSPKITAPASTAGGASDVAAAWTTSAESGPRGPGPGLSSIVPVVIDTVAWVRLEHGRILCARPREKDIFYIPGGKREGGGRAAGKFEQC